MPLFLWILGRPKVVVTLVSFEVLTYLILYESIRIIFSRIFWWIFRFNMCEMHHGFIILKICIILALNWYFSTRNTCVHIILLYCIQDFRLYLCRVHGFRHGQWPHIKVILNLICLYSSEAQSNDILPKA